MKAAENTTHHLSNTNHQHSKYPPSRDKNKKTPSVNLNSVAEHSKAHHTKQNQVALGEWKEVLLKHPAWKYMMGTTPSNKDFKKFVTYFYQGLFYSVCNLKGPTLEYVQKKSIKLPERKGTFVCKLDSKNKFLMLDLDETLIHSIFNNDSCDVSFAKGEDCFRFNIRPHCLDFLEKMSQHYDIYVFTASTEDYALPIIDYLNSKRKTILGALTRKHCMETNNGFRIKDLRIIKNRTLDEIVLVDNLVHSFGLQIENGIPILDFTNNSEDSELIGLERLLLQIKDSVNVRPTLQNKLNLKKCLEIDEDLFIQV